ncbi:MAG: response regulator transcription factor [Alphaproteobacteria bacterium]|nr:response regulator transcription factor [Alphaproteobacteria bacterium]
MDILSVNADRKLFEIASSITQNPQTWHGWFCLKLDLTACNDTLYEASINLACSVIRTHLKDIRGDVFICENKLVHILCKPPSEKILEQTGVQMCDLITSENGTQPTHRLYDLFEHGYDYARNITGETDSIFKLPQSGDIQKDNHVEPEEENVLPLKQPDSTGKKMLSPQENVKVLLVEDDPITRWMVRNSLKNICDFATAPTASKAYAMFSSYQPDVVFLDINLPDNNGKAVLDWIMNHDPGACVVMFSSNGSLENITECLNNGASGFITKPFLREDLIHYVQPHNE